MISQLPRDSPGLVSLTCPKTHQGSSGEQGHPPLHAPHTARAGRQYPEDYHDVSVGLTHSLKIQQPSPSRLPPPLHGKRFLQILPEVHRRTCRLRIAAEGGGRRSEMFGGSVRQLGTVPSWFQDLGTKMKGVGLLETRAGSKSAGRVRGPGREGRGGREKCTVEAGTPS